MNNIHFEINGIQMDSNLEAEYFSDNKELGFTVIEHDADGSSTIFNNVTEIHWLYRENNRTYQSDIHSTGHSWYLQGGGYDVKKVIVQDAIEIAESF
jgi:hypothetical protein